MASACSLPLCLPPKMNFPIRSKPMTVFNIPCSRSSLKKFSIAAAAADGSGISSRGASSRIVREREHEQYSQSQAPIATVKGIDPFILHPFILYAAGAVAVSLAIEKFVGLIFPPKQSANIAEKNKRVQRLKQPFGYRNNLLTFLIIKPYITPRWLDIHIRELRSSPRVDLSGRYFEDSEVSYLAYSLLYNEIAKEVSFANNLITAKGIKSFHGVLQSNSTLESLNLSGNSIGDQGAKHLCDILVNNSGVKKLQLSSNSIGDEGAKAIGEMLKKNSTLRIVELNNNSIGYSGFSGIAEGVSQNKTILSISLNGNDGGSLGAAALARGLEGNRSLRELYLQGNNIRDDGVIDLMSCLCSHIGNLTVLDLANNLIGARGAPHVAEYIKKSKSLYSISLNMNDIGDEGAEKIAEALRENQSVTNVNLGGNNIHAQGITPIARVLKHNSVITSLDLGYNPIGPDGAKALAEALKFHGNLKDLMLGWCRIGPTGAEYIADMLKYNSTVSSLDLRGNSLGDKGIAYLAHSLKVVNEALTSLNLGFNEITDEGAFAIAHALKDNGDVQLTFLNLKNNLLSEFGQIALSDVPGHVYEMNEKELIIDF